MDTGTFCDVRCIHDLIPSDLIRDVGSVTFESSRLCYLVCESSRLCARAVLANPGTKEICMCVRGRVQALFPSRRFRV